MIRPPRLRVFFLPSLLFLFPPHRRNACDGPPAQPRELRPGEFRLQPLGGDLGVACPICGDRGDHLVVRGSSPTVARRLGAACPGRGVDRSPRSPRRCRSGRSPAGKGWRGRWISPSHRLLRRRSE